MFDQIVDFAETLRLAGVPVSMTEVVDAGRAISAIGEVDRSSFRVALYATLVKDESHSEVFDLIFDVFFSKRSRSSLEIEDPHGLAPDHEGEGDDSRGSEIQGARDQGDSGGELRSWIIKALLENDRARLSRLARGAVARYAGMEPGRAVSGVYYTYRTLKQLNIEMIYDALREARSGDLDGGKMSDAVVENDLQELLSNLRSAVADEVRQLLVEDRGARAVAKTMRPTLPEDIEFMQASRDEIAKIRHAINPLANKLAARLARRRRLGHKGGLDFRKTFRESLGYGGVPMALKFRSPRPSKPEIFIVADISGSVSSFARFALQLVYALSEQFSKVRSFVFIDACDEVTAYFDAASSIEDALRDINTKANVVHIDGHTDYGNALSQFEERYGRSINKKSTIIILGDARNNYHSSRAELLAKLRRNARALFWLNPEPSNYWNSGDSIISEYAKYCDSVVECRNLRQLEEFVDRLG